VRPLAPSRVDACNPLLQAHPTWARDKHEGRGISTSHARLPPSHSVSRRPIWAGACGNSLLVGPGTPRSRNADKMTLDISLRFGFLLATYILIVASPHLMVHKLTRVTNLNHKGCHNSHSNVALQLGTIPLEFLFLRG
jgi:hypothetical protein